MRWRDFDTLPPLQPAFFDVPRRVHFVGIGGIGMSALAKLLASRGHQVSGSDAHESPALNALCDGGMNAVAGHRVENLYLGGQPAEALVFSSAVREDNPERQEAARLGVPQHHRGQLLAYFVNTAKTSVAVSGTHGKSTTSAMVAHILTQCGHDPTAILGAAYPPFDGNLRIGNPDLVVVEADESDGSFTLLHPTIAVITNVEPEHLENYDDSEEELWRAFEMFSGNARGTVVNYDDSASLHLNPYAAKTSFYSEGPDGDANPTHALWAHDFAFNNDAQSGGQSFEVSDDHRTWGISRLPLPGDHNISNAIGAMLASEKAGADASGVVPALDTFTGIARRFEKKGEAGGIMVYDDYAHHPTEVRATLEAARDFLQRPVTVIFQPHRYSRTAQMGRDFGPAFEAADRVIVTELYSAFEEPIAGVSGHIVFDALREAFPDKIAAFAPTLDDARRMGVADAQPGDVIFTMGAGDISNLGPLLLNDLQSKEEGE